MISNDTIRQLILDDIDPLECNEFEVRKRDGRLVRFDASLIQRAIEKAFKAEAGLSDQETLGADEQATAGQITEQIMKEVIARAVKGEQLEIELIQDAVENRLMDVGYYKVARRYIVYREERHRMRLLAGNASAETREGHIMVRHQDGRTEPFDSPKIRRTLVRACTGYENRCKASELAKDVLRTLYNGVTTKEIDHALMRATRNRIEKQPAYGYVAARLLLHKCYQEAWGRETEAFEFESVYKSEFKPFIKWGVEQDRLSNQLLRFDLDRLSEALVIERDAKLNYLGAQTLYDHFLTQVDGRRMELPQYLWMRVAMGLALDEGDQKNDRAIAFYHLLSSFRFMPSTPTLLHSGTLHAPLSSCYLLTIDDNLGHIFKTISDDALLAKWAGGLGNDWTNVRAAGAPIKGTNGCSQGIVPFLKVANDTAVAVNQGGKRKSAMCAYLETWHLDIEDFLDLRKKTGDERRRTYDLHTAHWIPDLFMKRVKANALWTLFCPSDCPDLHELYGADFEAQYAAYEAMTQTGELKLFKQVEALSLWRNMLTALCETGHPWITFKDPSNIRSPQQHTGVVHSSNLCTEILLNTSSTESAVCNLGSINLVEHISPDGTIDHQKLEETVTTAIRMLDNVININFYPTPETERANLRHRPIGLGCMGFQDALYTLSIAYDSEEAVEFSDAVMEEISCHAIMASSKLAKEKGSYESYEGSLWSLGLLPIDSLDQLAEERGGYLEVDRSSHMDWGRVREHIELYGMRNSNCMAIAPTATIATLTGVSPSIEPACKQRLVISTRSGEFTVVNPYLVEELKARGLWDDAMMGDLKYFEGSIQEIDRIPDDVKALYKGAFEMSPNRIIDCASRRQKWIDMSQSLNLYLASPDERKLSELYMAAWEKGLKTTYGLHSLSTTHAMDTTPRSLPPRRMKNRPASSNIEDDRGSAPGH